MSKVVVTNNVTLDGVMQAPARPDEDTRGGFTHGGWALPYNDAVMGRVMASAMAEGMAKGGALLGGEASCTGRRCAQGVHGRSYAADG